MRIWFIFVSGIRVLRRDRVGLFLGLFTAPLFVVLYWILFSDAPTEHHVALLNEDTSASSNPSIGSQVVEAISNFEGQHGTPLFNIREVSDRAAAKQLVMKGEVDVGIVIPKGFEADMVSDATPAEVEILGNATSSTYFVATSVVLGIAEKFAARAVNHPPMVEIVSIPLGLSAKRTPFENYVPGLLVFAVIMLIFSTSMAVVREVEAGTLARLRLTPAGSLELLLGFSLVQLLVGGASIFFTLLVAIAFGFKSAGSLPLTLGVAILACFASVGVGMVIAGIAKTQNRSFLIASAVMFLLILFSGVIFPRPDSPIFFLGTRTIDLFDFLFTTNLSRALTKVMTLGADVTDIAYEIVSLIFIGGINMVFGALLFARSGRPAAESFEGLP